MAPKRKTVSSRPIRTSRAAVPEPDPQDVFVSVEAGKRYTASIKARGCIQERGIETPTDSMQTLITQRQWETFVAQPEAARVPVVREFYANVVEHRELKAWVRGKWVPFDRTTINRVFNLPDIHHCGYTQIVEHGVDYDDVLKFLASDGAEWEIVDEVPKKFSAKFLRHSGKLWHYFISARLMPSTNISAVSRDRAILNYAIQKGQTVDIGRVIEQSILQLARVGKGGFGHPSLIYALCLRAQVPTSPSEEIQRPKPPIIKDNVKPPPQSGDASGKKKSTTAPSTSRQGGRVSVVAAVESLRQDMRDLHRRIDQVIARQDRLAVRSDLQYGHLVRMIRASHQAGSSSQPQFPDYPTFPPYPPEFPDYPAFPPSPSAAAAQHEEDTDEDETMSEASDREAEGSESAEATEDDDE